MKREKWKRITNTMTSLQVQILRHIKKGWHYYTYKQFIFIHDPKNDIRFKVREQTHESLVRNKYIKPLGEIKHQENYIITPYALRMLKYYD